RYTPTQEEIATGEIKFTLSIITNNPSPCNTVNDVVIIKINPANKITSAASLSLCTNTTVNYQPKAILEGSTFTWTATGSENASGFSAVGTGNITDIVSNTDLSKDATIRYTIIANYNGCSGEPFTLTVTIGAS